MCQSPMLHTLLKVVVAWLCTSSVTSRTVSRAVVPLLPKPLRASNVRPTCDKVPCDDNWIQQYGFCRFTCTKNREFECQDTAPTCLNIRSHSKCNAQWVVANSYCKHACSSNGNNVPVTRLTKRATATAEKKHIVNVSEFPFYIGVNMPWIDGRYGWHFGKHHQWGAGYDARWVDKFFGDVDSAVPKNANVGLLGRVFVFGDMRGGIVDNMVTNETITDIVSMLDAAAKTRVRVVLSILDFHMCDKKCDVFKTDASIQSFIDGVVKLLIEKIDDHPAVWAIECMNEPEWAIQESGRAFTEQQMALSDAQKYCARINALVHKTTGFLTASGSASAMWSSFWTDDAMRSAYPTGGDAVTFDVDMAHMYSFSAPEFDLFAKPASDFSRFKPFIIGETGRNDPLSYVEKLRQACRLGYVGVLPWSYGASDGVATWEDIRPALESFAGCGEK